MGSRISLPSVAVASRQRFRKGCDIVRHSSSKFVKSFDDMSKNIEMTFDHKSNGAVRKLLEILDVWHVLEHRQLRNPKPSRIDATNTSDGIMFGSAGMGLSRDQLKPILLGQLQKPSKLSNEYTPHSPSTLKQDGFLSETHPNENSAMFTAVSKTATTRIRLRLPTSIFKSIAPLDSKDISCKDSYDNTNVDMNRNKLSTETRVAHEFPLQFLTYYLAMMDEITTWALCLSDPINSRPGVSVHLSCYPGAAYRVHQKQQNEQQSLIQSTPSIVNPRTSYELISDVTKIGRNLGFVQYQVVQITSTNDDDNNDDDNHNVIILEKSSSSINSKGGNSFSSSNSSTSVVVCYGTHIKYLPMGKITEFFLSKYGWYFTKLYCQFYEKNLAKMTTSLETVDGSNNNRIGHIFETFRYDPLTRTATFECDIRHKSLGGPIHGGCQAMLMELTGRHIVMNEHNHKTASSNCISTHCSNRIVLESISVEYVSAPSKYVMLQGEILSKSSLSSQSQQTVNQQQLNFSNNIGVDMIIGTNHNQFGTTNIPYTDSSTSSDSMTFYLVRVALLGAKDGKVKSQGCLRFTVDSPSKNTL